MQKVDLNLFYQKRFLFVCLFVFDSFLVFLQAISCFCILTVIWRVWIRLLEGVRFQRSGPHG